MTKKRADIPMIRVALSESNSDLPVCSKQIVHQHNFAPDFTPEDKREEWIFTHRVPCCRPEGHVGACVNPRPVVGWPGKETLVSLMDEVEELQDRVEELTSLVGKQREIHSVDQQIGRTAGITYEAVREVMSKHLQDDEDGTSFGRMVEEIRALAIGAASSMVKSAGGQE